MPRLFVAAAEDDADTRHELIEIANRHPDRLSREQEDGDASMAALRRVALLIETSREYGRGLIRGAARYHREIGHWSIYFQPHGSNEPPPSWLARWRGDGILARIDNRQVAKAVGRVRVPVVDLSGVMPHSGHPFLGVDNREVAALAFNHLRQHGFRHFGFCGLRRGDHPLMDARCDSFSAFVRDSGAECHVFQPSSHARVDAWDHRQQALADWLKVLPTPIGVMTCNDDVGLQVLDACRRAGVMVPDEVAVLGVDNDEYLCGLAIPPLTSIDVMPERIGYEAAALLDRMMNGDRPLQRPLLLAPRGIVARKSTDVMATDDRDVVRAVAFIRERACRRIRVTDVLAHVSLSRTAFEPRVRQVLGRTIHQEIQRVQLEQAKHLLAMTDLPIKAVAVRCGFASQQYLSRIFRHAVGQSPAQYRKHTSR